MLRSLIALLALLALGGCQTWHSLPPVQLEPARELPVIHVSGMGDLTSAPLREALARRGAFADVQRGHDPEGYNVIVLAQSDLEDQHNLPLTLLSACTLFIVPAPVSWNSQMMFHLSRGDRPLAKYMIDNRTRAWRGLFNPDGGRNEHLQRIADDFIAQMRKDPSWRE
ncbi:hypothetical protein [Pseudomonas piscis]|uniref:Lipoprotein n=1 Tax=Pseudomonas piscis TaxID=2614538 RepID=A0A7X1PIG8_9PSED|nr:hypothetical protein [Pseudomonas piscis]MQA52781.1 hypothetical protein [Pseudomonas piscis]